MCTDNGWLTKTGLYLGWQGSRKHVAEIPIAGMRTALSWRHCLGSPTAGFKISAVCGWYTGGWVSIQLSTYFEKQASFDDMIWKGCVNIVFSNFQMTWEFCFAIFIAKFEQGTFKCDLKYWAHVRITLYLYWQLLLYQFEHTHKLECHKSHN